MRANHIQIKGDIKRKITMHNICLVMKENRITNENKSKLAKKNASDSYSWVLPYESAVRDLRKEKEWITNIGKV